jgi:hypothetical protein
MRGGINFRTAIRRALRAEIWYSRSCFVVKCGEKIEQRIAPWPQQVGLTLTDCCGPYAAFKF